MNELIKITVTKIGEVEAQSVSGRDLHVFLGATERYNSWFDRYSSYGFEQDIDFVRVQTSSHPSNQALDDHIMSVDMAKELSMLQRTEKGKQARKYFLECERQAKQQIAKPKRNDYKAMALANSQRQVEVQAKLIAALERSEALALRLADAERNVYDSFQALVVERQRSITPSTNSKALERAEKRWNGYE